MSGASGLLGACGLLGASGLPGASGLAGAAVCTAGRRRMDTRVTARTMAKARAARPANWALPIGAPSSSADVSAAS